MPSRKITISVKDLGETDLTIEQPDVSDAALEKLFGEEGFRTAVEQASRTKLEQQRQANVPPKVEVEGTGGSAGESAGGSGVAEPVRTYTESVKAGLHGAKASGLSLLRNAFQAAGDAEKAVEKTTGVRNFLQYEPNAFLAKKLVGLTGVRVPGEGYTETANQVQPFITAAENDALEAGQRSKSKIVQGLTQAAASAPVAVGSMMLMGPVPAGAVLGGLGRYHEGAGPAAVGAGAGAALGWFNQRLNALPLRQRMTGNAALGGLGVAAAGDTSTEGLAFGMGLGLLAGAFPGGKRPNEGPVAADAVDTATTGSNPYKNAFKKKEPAVKPVAEPVVEPVETPPPLPPPVDTPPPATSQAAAKHFPTATQATANAASDVSNAAKYALRRLRNIRASVTETGIEARKKNLDASTSIAQSEALAGERKVLVKGDPSRPHETMVPDMGALGKTGEHNSPYEAFGNYLAGASGKVQSAMDAVESGLSEVIKYDGDLTQFDNFMTAERLAEMMTKNPQYQLPRDWDHNRVIDTLKSLASHPQRQVFEQAADGMRGMANDLLDQSVDAGLLHPNARDAMKAGNQKFSPFERLEKVIPGGDPNEPLRASSHAASMSQDQTKTFNPISIEGSDLELGGATNAFLRLFETRIHQIERAKTVTAYTDMVDRAQNPRIGRRGVNPPGAPPNTPKPKMAPGEGVIYKWENGQAIPYFVPTDVVDAYNVMNRAQMGVFANAMTAYSRAVSHMATSNPVYVASNIWRDFFNVHMNSPVPYQARDVLAGLFTYVDGQYFKGKLSGGKSVAVLDQMKAEGATGGGMSSQGKGVMQALGDTGSAIQNSWDRARGRNSSTPGGPFPHPYREMAAPEASFLTTDPREFMQAGKLVKKRLLEDPIGYTVKGTARGVKAAVFDVFDKPMTGLSEISEKMGRTGLWMRLGKENDPVTGKPFTPERRAYITNTMATPFHMRGTSQNMDLLYRMTPFLRARMLGMMTSADNMASKAVNDKGKFAAAVAFAAVPAMAFHLWNTTKYPNVWKEIPQEERDTHYFYIYGDHKDEDGMYDQVVRIPKEGSARAIANAVTNFLDLTKGDKAEWQEGAPSSGAHTEPFVTLNKKEKVSRGYANMAAQFLSDTFSPVDVYSDGKITPVKAVRSVVPPIISTGMDVLANRDLRLERQLWAGDRQIPSSRAFITEAPKGRRNTSQFARALSSGSANLFGEKPYEDIMGRVVSPVAIDHAIRSTAGSTGMGIARTWDPLFGSVNSWLTKRLDSAQNQGDTDYPRGNTLAGRGPAILPSSQSIEPAMRTMDFRRSFSSVYAKPEKNEISDMVDSAIGRGASMRKEVHDAVNYVVNSKALDPVAGEDKTAASQRAKTAMQTAFARHKLGPEDLKEFARVMISKLASTADGFDTVSRAIQHMDNRQKAIFISELTVNPETRGASKSADGTIIPAGPKNKEAIERITKMVRDGELSQGVIEEMRKLDLKKERGAKSQKVQ